MQVPIFCADFLVCETFLHLVKPAACGGGASPAGGLRAAFDVLGAAGGCIY